MANVRSGSDPSSASSYPGQGGGMARAARPRLKKPEAPLTCFNVMAQVLMTSVDTNQHRF